MDKKTLNQDDFITELASRAGFTKSDVKLIYDTIVEMFEEAVKEESILKLHNLGKLEVKKIKSRLGRNGESLPETNRVIFKLAENIRRANKENK